MSKKKKNYHCDLNESGSEYQNCESENSSSDDETPDLAVKKSHQFFKNFSWESRFYSEKETRPSF